MNKKELILAEAKRLSGRYGYLGFTLKQLAQACQMTAPALYYFYSSKADLFKDCMLSELEVRNVGLVRIAEQSTTMPEFAQALIEESFAKCGASCFRTGQAMMEIIHLPEEIQLDIRAAWERLLIAPVAQFFIRVMPDAPEKTLQMLATFMINNATFAAANVERFEPEALSAMLVAAANGLLAMQPATASA